MEKLTLEQLYDFWGICENGIDKDEIIWKKKNCILKILQTDESLPDIYHINDTLEDLEKRYKYYILDDTSALTVADNSLDKMCIGIQMVEGISQSCDLGINLKNFTKNTIQNKKRYKESIQQISDKYMKPASSINNPWIELGIALFSSAFTYHNKVPLPTTEVEDTTTAEDEDTTTTKDESFTIV